MSQPPIVPGPEEPYPPHLMYQPPQPVQQQPEPTLPKPVTGTLWVLLTLFAVFCGLPMLCWTIVMVIGGIGSLSN